MMYKGQEERMQKEKTAINSLNTEWIPYMKAYRLYDVRYPQQTVAYEEDAAVAEQRALEEGYAGLVLCDADTMHVECQ